LRCMSLILAQSGHSIVGRQCPLLGVKRTSTGGDPMSAFDPKRTLTKRCSPWPLLIGINALIGLFGIIPICSIAQHQTIR
jgi:hypothetical protein